MRRSIPQSGRIVPAERRGTGTIPILAGIGLAALLTAGCAGSWKYRSLDYARPPDHQPIPRRVTIVPFQDYRPRSDEGGLGRAYIPLIPYSSSRYHRSESWRVGAFSPVEEFHLIIAEHLRESEVFADVDQSNEKEPAGADLILEGAIWTTTLERTLYTYGISVFAAPLWFLGLPVQRTRAIISGYCRIVDSSSGDILWDTEFRKSWNAYRSVFYRQRLPTMRDLARWAANGVVLRIDEGAFEGRFE